MPDGSLAEELNADVAFDPAAADVRNATEVTKSPAQRMSEADAKVREEDARQAKQNTLWRRLLFWGVAGIVVAVVVVDVYVILTYISGGTVDPLVLSTFFAGSVAQVIGLLVIITRHLFPGSK